MTPEEEKEFDRMFVQNKEGEASPFVHVYYRNGVNLLKDFINQLFQQREKALVEKITKLYKKYEGEPEIATEHKILDTVLSLIENK